ncbi:extracellular solute-binding protein [Konateibacter massiliensis]|uniref:extracellular solute-binding protein n=1 Tax=Konateibacter massiliensis TaxID=2002841 RepID=UPI001F23C7E8|nr:extracellular solute-binding protein [Konateibacter massiliensis]
MKRRIVGAAMGAILAAGVVMGCAADADKSQRNTQQESMGTEELTGMEGISSADTPGWQLNADIPVTLDWYVNYSWFTTPWGENLVSKKITEETGVNINFITPSGNETEKLNALIASDSLPDLITLGWWEPQINEMIENDMVYGLNELADEYDIYFYQVAGEAQLDWYTQEDGNIYGYPNSSCTPADLEEHDNISSNEDFLVRKDIYEAIGSPDMTTPEGFKAAVKKAAEMFPEVNGEPLIPIGGDVFNGNGNVSFDKYLMNFLAIPWEKDGEIYDRYTDADYITWLKVFRELGEEGLLADDIFIDQRTQMEEKIEKGRYFCMIYQYTDMVAQQKALYETDPDSIYMAVDGPKNAEGDAPTLPTTGINGWTITLISKNCSNPDRAIQFMDYLISEHGQMMIYLGVEGETYDMVDGEPVIKQEVKDVLNTDRAEYDRLYGADDTYWMLQNNIMQLKWKQKSIEPIAQMEEWSYPYVVYNGQYDMILPSDSEVTYADKQITALWSTTLPKLLLADTEEQFDELLSDFVQKRESLGYDEVQQVKTELMVEAKKKLGLEE